MSTASEVKVALSFLMQTWKSCRLQLHSRSILEVMHRFRFEGNRIKVHLGMGAWPSSGRTVVNFGKYNLSHMVTTGAHQRGLEPNCLE